MIVLKQANEEILKQLGGIQHRTEGKKYRMNKYCLESSVDDGTVIHNCFTGAEVMIKPFEYINIFTTQYCDYAQFLLANYFIVPEDFEEDVWVEIIRERQRMPITATYLEHPNKFIILTTTKCNARCFYCYELSSKHKTHMTYDTAEKVANYIINNAPKNQPIELGWFGGEPLFNSDVIEIICSRLASARLNFSSHMISNCYLFDEAMVEKAKTEWRVKNVQCTLDGTEDTYNKIKNYIYKDGISPYKKVIEGVQLLVKAGIPVSVRMNCDFHNAANLKELILELDSVFKGVGNFSMYIWPLFEIGFTRGPKEKETLYNSILELENLLVDLGYPIGHRIPNMIKGVHCMVDSGEAITITPNGDIGLCEHYIDRDFISHIDNPLEKDFDMIRSWRNYVQPTEYCNDCPLFPICLKMKKCPDEIPCEEFQKNYWINHYKLELKCNYIMYKQEQLNKSCSCEDKCNNVKCEKL